MQHRLAERVFHCDDRYRFGKSREMQRRLAGGISAANHKDILIAAKRGFARARTVVNSSAQELLLFGKIQPAIFDAGGADGAAGHDFGSTGQVSATLPRNYPPPNPTPAPRN